MVVRGGLVFVGGRFTKAMGASRSALAVFSASTGALSPLDVPVTGNFAPSTTPTVSTLDVTPNGGALVIGGSITTTGAQSYSDTVLDLNGAAYTTASGAFTESGAKRLTGICLLGNGAPLSGSRMVPEYAERSPERRARDGTLCESTCWLGRRRAS